VFDCNSITYLLNMTFLLWYGSSSLQVSICEDVTLILLYAQVVNMSMTSKRKKCWSDSDFFYQNCGPTCACRSTAW